MKIEVGDFVRTKKGIGKILEIKTVQPKMYGKHDVAYLINVCLKMYISKTVFIKHSKDIIDLIEVGDYVNGEHVYKFGKAKNGQKWIHILSGYLLYNKDITTVVTKEQMRNMQYVVGGEQ